MAKKKKNSTTNYYIGIAVLLIVAIVCLLYYYSDANIMNREMKQDGYTTTEEEDPFYKKITTGNTIDDYYNDLAMNKDTAYEEYYLPKNSYNFLEQKLIYQSGATIALNISSDLRNLYTIFSYEVSYKDAYLLMEGNSNKNYECEIVMNKSVSKDSIQTACNKVKQELEVFASRRTEILANSKVQEMIQNAPAVVQNNNNED